MLIKPINNIHNGIKRENVGFFRNSTFIFLKYETMMKPNAFFLLILFHELKKYMFLNK